MSAVGEGQRSTLRVAVFLDGVYDGDPGWYVELAGRVDVVVAADGGGRFLVDHGLAPDVVVGDFDSLDPEDAGRLEVAGVPLIRHPVRKDVTDGELAVNEALRRGADEILLAGAVGALDHTLGHLAILRRLTARGIAARLVAPHLTVTVLSAPACVRLAAPAGVRVSLVPLGGDATVTLAGLDYLLDRGVLPADACLGLGNHISSPGAATVTLHAGTVAALVEADVVFAAASPESLE